MTKKKLRRKAGTKKNSSGMPGWVHMLAGLAIGLAVALGIYVSDRQQPPTPAPAEVVPESAPVAGEVIPDEPEKGITYDFYDMLPNLDVELYDNAAPPGQRAVVQPKLAPAPTPAPKQKPPVQNLPTDNRTSVVVARPVDKPGIYILQAGSFSLLEVAQRRKAEIALLGVHTEIKKGNVNGKTVYRVYTDPMDKPADVNRVRTLLNGVGIDILMKRVSD
jgi:hypothetical protein